MQEKKTQPETASDWDIMRALRGVVRPYRSGSAYNVARVETHDGGRTVVHGLSVRSRQHANVGEVEDALNRAHIDGLGLGLEFETNRRAAWVVLRRAFELNDAALETAAVLVCDALQIGTEATGDSWSGTPPVLRRLASLADDDTKDETFRAVCESLRAAVALNR
jgi:hypothetical protein